VIAKTRSENEDMGNFTKKKYDDAHVPTYLGM
jgi:hypothetical protein